MRTQIIAVVAAAFTLVALPSLAADDTKVPTGTTNLTQATVTQEQPNPALTPAATPSAPARDTKTVYQQFRPNRPLLAIGSVLFLGTYATTAGITAANDLDRNLYIPVAGPWVHLADEPADASTMDTVLVAGSGVLQGAGVLFAAASLFVPEKVGAAVIEAGQVKLHVVPTAGRASAGIGAVGTF